VFFDLEARFFYRTSSLVPSTTHLGFSVTDHFFEVLSGTVDASARRRTVHLDRLLLSLLGRIDDWERHLFEDALATHIPFDNSSFVPHFASCC
jgi:hypothetical protein